MSNRQVYAPPEGLPAFGELKLKLPAAPLKRDLHHTTQAGQVRCASISWLRGVRSLLQFKFEDVLTCFSTIPIGEKPLTC
jgi:hypothetical protein